VSHSEFHRETPLAASGQCDGALCLILCLEDTNHASAKSKGLLCLSSGKTGSSKLDREAISVHKVFARNDSLPNALIGVGVRHWWHVDIGGGGV
jgi:hypothetical protein